MYFKRLKRKFRYNRKKRQIFILLFILLCSLGLAYASITTSLSINGVSKFNNASWDVHFANIQVKNGSVVPTTAPTISNNTTVSFAATLEEPGEYYEFNIDVVNSGTINAMIDSIEILPVLTTEQQAYFDYIVTYADGTSLAPTHKLDSGSTEKLRIAFIYKTLDDTTNYPDTDQSFTISVGINYVQQTNSAIDRPVPTFANDSWETIITNVKSGTIPSYYTVGSTKEVELSNSLGTHTLRIANTSTPSECSTTGFSQTACGFVLEFADIITTHNMNPSGTYKGTQYDYGWNVDGWPESSMRDYLNNENDSTSIINSLPTVIKDAIADTTVVSGHGSTSGETNFTSTDKLYLLSPHEVWEDVDGNTSDGIDYYDTAYNNTRQLDYYANQGLTSSNYAGAIKQYNSSNNFWWLRSVASTNPFNSFNVNVNGDWDNFYASNDNRGVAPAFRLG